MSAQLDEDAFTPAHPLLQHDTRDGLDELKYATAEAPQEALELLEPLTVAPAKIANSTESERRGRDGH